MIWRRNPFLFLAPLAAFVASAGLGQSSSNDAIYKDAQASAQSALSSAQTTSQDTSNATANQNPNFSTDPYNGQVTLENSGTPGTLANMGNNQDVYQQMVTSQQTQVQFNPADMKALTNDSTTVANNPNAYVAVDASGTQVSCQPVPPSSATSTSYTSTCNSGEAVATSSRSCTVLSTPTFSTTYNYACNEVATQQTVNGVVQTGMTTSACQAYRAAGCAMQETSTTVLQQAWVFGPEVDNNQYAAACSAQTQGTISGIGSWYGTAVAFQATGTTTTQTGSTIDASACSGVTSECPSTYTYSNGSCVKSVAATVAYSCENGWTLSGTQCSIVMAQPGAVNGYNCPSGYTLSGNNCTATKPATISSYQCPSGFSLSGTTCTETLTQAANTTGYTCTSGFTLNGSSCTETLNVSPTPVYSCPTGWTLSGSTCTQATTIAASPACQTGWTYSNGTCQQSYSVPATQTYSCPSGWTVSGSTCTQPAPVVATAVQYCEAGQTAYGGNCRASASYLNGGTCPASSASGQALLSATITGVRSGFWVCTYAPLTKYVCPSGLNLFGTSCYLPGTSTEATTNQTCITGQILNGTTCDISSIMEVGTACPATSVGGQVLISQIATAGYRGEEIYRCSYAPIVTYSCSAGYALSGSTCNSTAIAATVNYSCSSGSIYGSSCNFTNIEPTNAACPNGFVQNGNSCTGTSTQTAAISYSCPTGYSNINGSCSEALTQAATPTLSCPDGYSVSGNSCSETLSQAATPLYACDSGWTQSGSSCTSTVAASPTGYNCPDGYTANGSQCGETSIVPAVATYSCPAGGSLSGSDCVSYATPSSTSGQGCSSPVDSCTDSSPQTRVVNGVSVTQPCWAWTRTYSCTTVSQGNNSCGDLEANGNCHLDHQECLDDPASSNGCQDEQNIYVCSVPGQASSAPTYVCQNGIYCVDGSCNQVAAHPSQDFAKAVTALSVIGTTQNELDPNNITLFEGTSNGCHKPLFGIENCCAGGPGIPLIGACSKDEEQLAADFAKGITTYVGTYCSSSVLGICLSEHETFCVFQSKLGRIIQEQGRPQLGLNFGTAKNPNCSGLTPQQFSELDLSKMDFSSILSDLTSDVTIPDETSTLTTLQSKIQAYYSSKTGS